MNWIDVGIVALILYHGAAGYRYGLTRTVLDLSGLVVVLVVAFTQFTHVAAIIQDALNISPDVARWLSLAGCLGVLMLVLDGLVSLIGRFIKQRRHSLSNRIGGVCMGGVRGMMTASMLLVLLTSVPMPKAVADHIEQSPLAPSARAVIPLVYDTLAPRVIPQTRSFHDQVDRYLSSL